MQTSRPAPTSVPRRRNMQITVNGKPESIDDDFTVADLLQRLGVEPIRVAVELNEEIVPRNTYSQTSIQQGDQIEVVTFVGGGSW